jgi:ABC-type maltose transport system permease subunit
MSTLGHGTSRRRLVGLAVLPLLLLFFLAQRYYIQGVVVSGVKG